MNKYHKLLLTVILFIGSAAIAQAQQVFVANLSGTQEVPAVTTGGRGVCKAVLNAAQTQLTVNCTYSGLSSSATAGHIHGNGAVGVNAPVLFSLGTVSGTSGTVSPSPITLTAHQVADLRANRFYVNIHTANNGGGEIRGQLHIANGVFDDYDGDGISDVTVFRPSEGIFYSRLSLNGGFRAQQFGISTDIIGRNADYDGDGISDYTVGRVNPGNGQVTTYILQSQTNSLRTIQLGNAALGDEFASADYDGDGKYDFGTFRNGLYTYIESSTGATRTFTWGQSGDVPVTGDYDGDGKFDFAVIRTVSNQYIWYIRQSSNNQLRVERFGQTGDELIRKPDFDGDGITDVNVVRVVNGGNDFYSIRSSDRQFAYFRWGTGTDGFRIGDYDGDGKSDYTVVRPINSVYFWFINRSSDNQFRTIQWGQTGDR